MNLVGSSICLLPSCHTLYRTCLKSVLGYTRSKNFRSKRLFSSTGGNCSSSSSMPPFQDDIMLANYDSEQVRLMEEMCIKLDKDDNVLGAISKKECHLMSNINEGLLHRAFSVFLFDTKGRLLLQKRADEKITFPAHWTNTCCSHPLNREEELDENDQMGVKRAAQRKLHQELGVNASDAPLNAMNFLTRIHYLAPSDGRWGEHEIDYILFMQRDVTFSPNPNEVSETRYVTQEELKELIDTADSKDILITPWFRLIYDSFLVPWWKNLDNLGPMVDKDTIHRL